jgi:hypothetical protein
LVIRKINHVVGHGLFLAPDAQPLAAGTLVAVYSGEVKAKGIEIGRFDNGAQVNLAALIEQAKAMRSQMQAKEQDDYEMNIGYCNSQQRDTSILSSILPLACVSAKKYGNWARFIQDLPSEEEVAATNLDPIAKANIATANLIIVHCNYFGIPLRILMTTCTVFPGQQFGYLYDDDPSKKTKSYWDTTKERRYVFNKHHQVMGSFSGKNITLLKSCSPSPQMNMPRIDREEFKKNVLPLIETPSINGLHPQQRFMANVKHALQVFSNRFLGNNSAAQIMQQLNEAANTNHFNQCYRKIRSIIGDLNNDKLAATQLIPLRDELDIHFKQYDYIYSALCMLVKVANMSQTQPASVQTEIPSYNQTQSNFTSSI